MQIKYLIPTCVAFKDHDTDDSGLLNSDYLYKALLSLSLPVEPSDMADLFECVGREKEQVVALDDFMDIVLELKVYMQDDDTFLLLFILTLLYKGDDTVPEEPELDIEDDDEDDFIEQNDTLTTYTAFQMLVDPAVNGITLESLLKVCKTQEESWTEQQVREMMNEADLNHDGMIDPNEFKIVCKKAGL